MHRIHVSILALVAGAVFAASPAAAQPAPVQFNADGNLSGSTLKGWTSLGAADWTIADGVVTGKPRRPEGGWLMSDISLTNLAFYTQIQCTGECRAGILMRAEKQADGTIKGIYVALSDADRGLYAVTLNAAGVELTRTRLKEGQSDGGMAKLFGNTPPHVLETMQAKNRTDVHLPAGVVLPALELPTGAYVPSGWNSLNLYLFGDALMPSVNGGSAMMLSSTNPPVFPQSLAPLEAGRYGPMALFVGGKGVARFKGVEYKDLTRRDVPVERNSPNYRMQRLDGFFYSWSTAVADFDRDGNPDIAAGPWVYMGPDYKVAREVYSPIAYNPTTDYPQFSTVSLAQDFTGDGWPDLIQFTGNAGYITGILLVNPRGENRPWDQHKVIDLLANEETILKDIDGDGVPEIIHGGPDYALGYTKPDPANPTGKWITTVVAESGPWGNFPNHGLGVGDIDGDGRADFVTPFGWWQQPAQKGAGLWKYHPAELARRGISQGGAGGAELGVYDVNGDGLNDVVTPLEGHGFGLAWNEQKRSANGEISFVQHIFMDGFHDDNAGGVMFTEPHAATYADMNGDGIPDMVTGKRQMSHLATWSDPDPYGEPVLYVYRTVRDPKAPGGARFEPELIHNFSGVGAHIQVADLNKDGLPDIQTSGPYGTFAFINQTGKDSDK